MQMFETIEDVMDWLEPLGYEAFWRAVDTHNVFGPEDRPHCDRIVAEGVASYETVLICMKATARIALTERLALKHRSTLPKGPDLHVVH